MAVSSAFIDMLTDRLTPLGPISVRRMFGGAGLFRNGLMFALIADDTLYLKADDQNRGAFETEGLGAFTYQTSSGKRSIMSYWLAPERLLDDAEEMQGWCRQAIDAAARADSAKSGKRTNSVARRPQNTSSAAARKKAGRKRPT